MNKTIKIFVTILLTLLAVLFAMQAITLIWNFPDGKPFSGEKLYNPYDSCTFVKGNFHAHTCFDTKQDYTTAEFIDAYKEQGYKIIGITDHQYINTSGFINSYEHGYGLNNFHIGMYGTENVDWLDNIYMVLPRHQMQTAFYRLKDKADVLVFNHSDRLRLMSSQGIEDIRGYDLFEITPTEGVGIWDKVLSKGFYVPVIGNDDAHSITDRNSQFQRAFTMLQYKNQVSVLSNLMEGKSYAVTITNKRNENGHQTLPKIENITLHNNTIGIRLDSIAKSITFIGQNGVHLYEQNDCKEAAYNVQDSDSYVRIEVSFDGIKFFSNPIARLDSSNMNESVPTVNWIWTIINWIIWITVLIFDLTVIRKMWNRRTNYDNYYRTHHSRKSRGHFESTAIGVGTKTIDWS